MTTLALSTRNFRVWSPFVFDFNRWMLVVSHLLLICIFLMTNSGRMNDDGGQKKTMSECLDLVEMLLYMTKRIFLMQFS